jgi:hypothetical protein
VQNIIKRTVVATILITVYLTVIFLVLPMLWPKKGDIIKIDCTWSEISPDYPIEVKEACRKARITT